MKPLAFGQYGELGPGFEQLLDQLAEEGADEAAKRYLIPNRVASSEGSAAPAAEAAGGDDSPKKAQADVLLHRLHYALPGWDAAAERRDAQDELHSAAPRQGRGLTATSMRTTALLSTGRCGPPGALEPGARPNRGGGGGCARALAVYKPPPPTTTTKNCCCTR
jgi:hypothetical protein